MPHADVVSNLPRIAVVVIGRNEGERLRRCLDSVRAMNYPLSLLEMIYVDSQSTDASPELAHELGARVVVLDGPTTAARGRNAGWRLVDTPFILFLDGDTILDKDFVRAALACFADPAIAAVGGHRKELDTDGSLYNAVFDVDWSTPIGPKPNFGGDALVRTQALRAVGGFNDKLVGGEEPEISRRMRELGYTILHIDALMTWHDLAIRSFRKYWRRSLRTGYAYAEISSIYARTEDPLWVKESRYNLTRGLFWILIPLFAMALSLVLRSFVPFLLGLGLMALPIGKTILSARTRTRSRMQALAYGLHAHLQHIPILMGQMQFWASGVRHPLPPGAATSSR